MRTKICENCHYWDSVGDEDGHCYRYPPTLNQAALIKLSNDAMGSACFEDYWSFPITKKEYWCGEFKKNIKEKPAPNE